MDRFADGMIARGPTLAADRATWAGSVHVLELASAAAARRFVEHEPYNRAGLFEQHFIWRFENLLGRTMWEYSGDADEPRFMIIANVPALETVPGERVIVHGQLLTPDEDRPVGIALALQAPTRQAADGLLRSERTGLDPHADVQILDWEFGGRH